MPRPGRKKFGIQVVMPEGMQCQPVYGAFLIDSFSYMVDRSVGRRKDYYVARMLKGLWQATGYVFMAVYRGGAAFTQGRGHVTYAQLLAEVPDGTELVIPVSMGNDFYCKGKFDMTVQQAVR